MRLRTFTLTFGLHTMDAIDKCIVTLERELLLLAKERGRCVVKLHHYGS